MSVEAQDIFWYGSANMQENDTGSPQGGAISKSKKVTFTDIVTTGTCSVVAEDTTDTSISITLYGRDAAGALINEAIATDVSDGRTESSGSTSFERILKATHAGSPTGCLAVYSNTNQQTDTATAGTTTSITFSSGLSNYNTDDYYRGYVIRITSGSAIGQLREIVRHESGIAYFRAMDANPGAASLELSVGVVFDYQPDGTNSITEVRRPFYNVAADPSTTKDYYEKVFVYNLNSTTTLSNATMDEATSGLSAKIEFAVEDALDDTGTSTNRVTAPASGFSAFTSSAENFPNSQNFTADSGCGIFLHLALSAGDAANNDTYALQVNGQTT